MNSIERIRKALDEDTSRSISSGGRIVEFQDLPNLIEGADEDTLDDLHDRLFEISEEDSSSVYHLGTNCDVQASELGGGILTDFLTWIFNRKEPFILETGLGEDEDTFFIAGKSKAHIVRWLSKEVLGGVSDRKSKELKE